MDGKEILNLLNFLKALSEDRRLRFEGPDCQVLRSRSDDHQQGGHSLGGSEWLCVTLPSPRFLVVRRLGAKMSDIVFGVGQVSGRSKT